LRKIKTGVFLNFRKENRIVEEQIKNFRIKTSSRDQIVNHLSGGNQQKVVLAKVLLNEPDIIILDEPTRGIDIGAKVEIYSLITKLASEGKAIIMVSSELPEIIGMSDRILVIHNGVLKAELTNAEASPELIMKHAMTNT
jgi:ABC-type sugar transport system ATPase subunit